MKISDGLGLTPDGLQCPSCGGEYLHHQGVEVWAREEDQDGVRVEVKANGDVASTRVPDHAPFVGRRGDVRIHFTCEMCEATPILILEQCKGQTLLSWGTK